MKGIPVATCAYPGDSHFYEDGGISSPLLPLISKPSKGSGTYSAGESVLHYLCSSDYCVYPRIPVLWFPGYPLPRQFQVQLFSFLGFFLKSFCSALHFNM